MLLNREETAKQLHLESIIEKLFHPNKVINLIEIGFLCKYLLSDVSFQRRFLDFCGRTWSALSQEVLDGFMVQEAIIAGKVLKEIKEKSSARFNWIEA